MGDLVFFWTNEAPALAIAAATAEARTGSILPECGLGSCPGGALTGIGQPPKQSQKKSSISGDARSRGGETKGARRKCRTWHSQGHDPRSAWPQGACWIVNFFQK